MKKGFTLSEVLITLGVIGIIAVLTIPAVMKNYRNKLYVAALKKTFAQIEDAVQAEMNDEHCSSFSDTKASAANSCSDAGGGVCEAGAGYLLNNYFRAIKVNCQSGTEKCLADKYTNIDGTDIGSFFGEYCIETTTGAAICIVYNPDTGISSVAVDINGPSEPNTSGRDVFVMNIGENGLVSDWDTTGNNCNTKSGSNNHIADYAAGCLQKIKNDSWQMKY